MKFAISSSTGNPDTEFSARFGRCPYFLIVDEGTGNWDKTINPAENAEGGAGTLVVQHLADQDVDAVISGRFGPNAYDALTAAGMNAYLAKSGTPRQLVDQALSGSLDMATGPTGEGMHHRGGRGGRGGQGGRR